jgi:hypothetical protein
MPNPSYASDALVYSLADAVAQNVDVKGKLWSKMLSAGSNTNDDFSFLEGPPESKKPIWKKPNSLLTAATRWSSPRSATSADLVSVARPN